MQTYTATYSPEDNKLRLYAALRLDAETYARVKACGFIWAPKQGLFVAPMWTPEREDLCMALAGEVGDEDTSLVDRAAERSERFEEYSDKRAADADRAHAAVAAIADNIPLGQPILVGHHSERHARKDAERIENGMRRAVKMWETSKYWTARAVGAIRHAKYKERPDVRARRIKGLEADQRKQERNKASAERALRLWSTPGLLPGVALRLAGSHPDCSYLPCAPGEHGPWSAYDVLQPEGERYKACPAMTVEEVQAIAATHYPARIAYADRWLSHLANRLAYERAMLDASGYTPPPRKASKADLPLLNYSGSVRFRELWGNGDVETEAVGMTKAELAALHPDRRGTRVSSCGTHRIRYALIGSGRMDTWQRAAVYLTDQKQHERPTSEAIAAKRADEEAAKERAALYKLAASPARQYTPPAPTAFDAMKESLRHGVQTVSAPQLFPTPPEVARQMVAAVGIMGGERVLEPSAGTGNLVRAIQNAATGADNVRVVAVEVNHALVASLKDRRTRIVYANDSNMDIRCADFLSCNGDLGTFDAVVMNPPFQNGDDVKHILHARHFLKPGGKLVALCANGPRQEAALRPLAETWEPLPDGTFSSEGTQVRVVMLTMCAVS